MGTFSVTLQAGDQRGESFESLEALVDTGATGAVVPGSVLRRLSVPHRTSTFELADETTRKWEMGRTWLRLDGSQEMTLVFFAAADAQPLLGDVTLEEFLLAPDPIRRELVRPVGF